MARQTTHTNPIVWSYCLLCHKTVKGEPDLGESGMPGLVFMPERPSGSPPLPTAAGLAWLPQPGSPFRTETTVADRLGLNGSAESCGPFLWAAVPAANPSTFPSGHLALAGLLGSQAPTRPQLPNTLGRERLASRRRIARRIQLRGHAPDRKSVV